MTSSFENNSRFTNCENTCRLCLEEDESLWSIFEVFDNDGVHHNIKEKIETLLDIVVEINDGLSDQVCNKCMTVVQYFFDFREQCRLHDKMLRESLTTLNLHYEKKEETAVSGTSPPEKVDTCSPGEETNVMSPNPQECQVPSSTELSLRLCHSSCSVREIQEVLSDNIVEVPLAQQLQQEWAESDLGGLDVIRRELQQAEFPWRIGEDCVITKKADEDHETCDNSNENLENVDPFYWEDTVNISQQLFENQCADSEEVGNELFCAEEVKCSSNLTVLEEADSMLENAEIDKVLTETGNFELSNELHAGRISRNKLGFWICNICNSQYKTTTDFRKHVARHYSECLNNCAECHSSFETAEELSIHERLHVSSSLVLGHACPHCHKYFLQKHLLEKHVASQHTSSSNSKTLPKKFRETCGKCVRVFYSSVEMENHDDSCNEGNIESEEELSSTESDVNNPSPVINNQKRMPCYLCKLSFDKFADLSFHFKESHDGKHPFKCEVFGCEKLFRTRKPYRDHCIRGHSFFTCEHCNKILRQKESLEAHIRKFHMKEKPYKCETCGKTFACTKQLYAHRQRHLRRYKCTDCGKLFGSPFNLSRHKVIHSGEPNYVCEYCGKKYLHMASLKLHTASHSLNLECKVCGHAFQSKYRLRIHEHQHTKKKQWGCKVCGLIYSHRSSRDNHKRKFHKNK